MPYINTIDINGEIYNLGNLTDGEYVVDLPSLQQDDVFVVQGDIINNLTSNQGNKPLSANQGRVINGKIADLGTQISNLKQQSEAGDATINSAIESLRSDMTNQDAETLSSAKTYSDELKQQLDDRDTALDDDITQLRVDMASADDIILSSAKSYADNLKKQSDTNVTGLDNKITQLRTDMGTNDESTLSSAKTYADEQSASVLQAAKEYADTKASSSETTTNTELDKKLDKTGGKISGDLEIAGVVTADQKFQAKYGITINQRGDVSKEITALCTGENAGKFIGSTETNLARIAVAAPTADDDAATKKYVDDKFLGEEVLVGGISTKTIDVSTPASGSLLIQVGSTNARLGAAQISADSLDMGETLISNVKTPVNDNDVATKGYVDSREFQIDDGAITKAKLAADLLNYLDGEMITSDTWTYIKKDSGLVIAWSSNTVTLELPANADVNSTIAKKYPDGLFIATPICIPYLHGPQSFYQYNKKAGTPTWTPELGIHNLGDAAAAVNVTVDFFVIGKWK